MLLKKDFTFDAAHNLVKYHGKCERLHGHTYRMSVTVKGDPDEEGMIADFTDVKKIVEDEIISKFDHAYLNDIFEQPSAENIARFVFEKLDGLLKGQNFSMSEVRIWESPTSSVIFGREDM